MAETMAMAGFTGLLSIIGTVRCRAAITLTVGGWTQRDMHPI